MAVYLDTSAATKLVLREAESGALRNWVVSLEESIISCDLIRTELVGAVRRRKPSAVSQAIALLDSITISAMAPSTFERAAQLDPVGLRSLGALHLAAALELGDELSAIVTYDERMSEASGELGLRVVAPR